MNNENALHVWEHKVGTAALYAESYNLGWVMSIPMRARSVITKT